MRHIYAVALLASTFLVASCSKDILKSYDKRVLGTWKIVNVNRYGFTSADALPFKEGDLLTFSEDGALSVQRDSNMYHGSWDIQRMQNSDDEDYRVLQLTAINFTNQQVRSEYFNDMAFTGTDRFKAFINYSTRVYVYRFARQ